MSTRRTLLIIHRWTGLILGALLLIQGATGASVVFREELNRAIHRGALTVVPVGAAVPLQTLEVHVRGLHPELTVRRIDFPRSSHEAFVFRMEGEGTGTIRYISVDPYRDRITRDAPLFQWPVHWLFEVHQALLSGPVGRTIVGVEGVALLVLTIVGPILGWPGRRGVRRSLTISFASGSRAVRDLHRVGGLVLAVILATSASTAILVIWHEPIQSMTEHIFPMTARPTPTVAASTNSPLLPLDEIVSAGRAKYGNALVKSVRFPGGHPQLVLVYLQASGTTRPRATDQVWVNGYTGEILGTYEAALLTPATTFFEWTLPVHTGQALGVAGRVLFVLGALGLQGLVVTGYVQWLARRGRPRANASANVVLRDR